MLRCDKRVLEVLERAEAGISLRHEDCVYFLEFGECSIEAGIIRAAAASILRSRNDNSAIILGQIGVETAKCTGKCKFCTFGEDHTSFEKMQLREEELEVKIRGFCEVGDLYGLFLMTMHEYDLDFFLKTVKKAKKIAPAATQLWANVGDSHKDAFIEMKKAGITGVYHVCRIGEGIDTGLNPEDRRRTMQNVLDAGLELYTCCEPIGPEHTNLQIVDNLFIGIELGCTQHAAMRRVAVPGTPLAKYGMISELRLAQIVAVVALASFTVPTMEYLGVHEPNELGYASGANIITAETGANPRDAGIDSKERRGMDMAACRRMLFECGFENIRRGDESKIPLNLDYLYQTNSMKG